MNRRQSVRNSIIDTVDETVLHTMAVDGLLKELGLNEEDRELLERNMQRQDLIAGQTIVHQGRNDVS